MRNRLQRLYGRGDLHFITFSCAARWIGHLRKAAV